MKKIIIVLISMLSIIKTNAQDKKFEEWYFNTNDSLRIYVKEPYSKSKDVVIVLHGGFGANHDYMLDAVKGLEDKYHFVFYDQRGSLMSTPRAPKEKLTFQKNVNDLSILMKELGLSKAKLLCHSMGTLVGMEFIKQHPTKVNNVVFVGAILPKANKDSDIFGNRHKKQVELLQNRKIALELLKPFKEKNKLSAKEYTRKWRIKFASVNVYNVKKHMLFKGGMAYYSSNVGNNMYPTVNWNYDYRNSLNKNGKVTYLQGDIDFLDFDATEIKKQLQECENISLKVFKNAGHNIWFDKPSEFKKELDKALSK